MAGIRVEGLLLFFSVRGDRMPPLEASAPLVLSVVIRGGLNVVVPAQTFFGPAALVAYLWLRRRGAERTMAEFLASPDVGSALTGWGDERFAARRGRLAPTGR